MIVRTDDAHYTAIAAAIREKTGTAAKYTPAQMRDGITEVYETGKKVEYDRFWDALQQNGERTDYAYAFSGRWNESTFRPKYDIKPTTATNMFYDSYIVDLAGSLEACGVALDFSACTNMYYCFVASDIAQLGVIDMRKATNTAFCFWGMPNLERIEKILMPQMQTAAFNQLFGTCPKLESMTIEGQIMQNGFHVSGCTKLNHDSLMSIINALETKSSGTWSVSLGAANLEKLTDAEKAIATEKGWTLV